MGREERYYKSEEVKYYKDVGRLLIKLLLLYDTVYKHYDISLCNIIRTNLTLKEWESSLLINYLNINSPIGNNHINNYWYELSDRQSRVDWLEKHIKLNT